MIRFQDGSPSYEYQKHYDKVSDHYAGPVAGVAASFSSRHFSEGRREPVTGLQRHPLIVRFFPGLQG
jgi:hypothetical protein